MEKYELISLLEKNDGLELCCEASEDEVEYGNTCGGAGQNAEERAYYQRCLRDLGRCSPDPDQRDSQSCWSLG